MVINKKANLKSKIFTVNNFVFLLIFGLIALFIAKQDKYIKTTFDGIKLWALTVLPSLLPFFFLSFLLTATNTVTKLINKLQWVSRFLYNAQGIALYIRIMSILSGYPMGAKIICDLYKNNMITKNQAEKYCTFTSTSGPLFIVGSIGIGMFANKTYGIVMLIAHLLGSLLTGVIFRKLPDNGTIRPLLNNKTYDSVLYEAVYSSVISVLIVGGFIAIFYTFSQMIYDLKILTPIVKLLSLFMDKNVAEGFLIGIIECTSGAKILSLCNLSKLTLSLTSAIVSLGGVSVWCQSIAYLSQAKIRIRVFITSKLLHAIITFCLSYILLTFL